MVCQSVPSARNPPKCPTRIGPVALVSGVGVGHFGEFFRRYKCIGASECLERDRGPGGSPSDRRERVRCGELKKGTGSAPAAGIRKGRSENLPFLVP